MKADRPEQGSSPQFSRFYVRQMSAEQLYESSACRDGCRPDATRTRNSKRHSRPSGYGNFPAAFGTDDGDEMSTFNGTIPQALMMFNGELTERATSLSEGTYLTEVVQTAEPLAAKLDQLFLSALARRPPVRRAAAGGSAHGESPAGGASRVGGPAGPVVGTVQQQRVYFESLTKGPSQVPLDRPRAFAAGEMGGQGLRRKYPLAGWTCVEEFAMGMSRRHFLEHLAGASSLALPALTFTQSLQAESEALRRDQKAAILLWMSGGPSTIDLWDLKPGASTSGPFQPIATSSDAQISEHLPLLAQQMHHLSIVRSMSTREADHNRGRYYMHTGFVPNPSVQASQLRFGGRSRIGGTASRTGDPALCRGRRRQRRAGLSGHDLGPVRRLVGRADQEPGTWMRSIRACCSEWRPCASGIGVHSGTIA